MVRHANYLAPFCFALLPIAGAWAGAPSGVSIDGAWMRVLTAQVPAGGYFTLRNGGSTPLTLTGARSPDCGMVMLHKSSDIGGMDNMQDVGNLAVPAGGTLTFAPGGYHLMCMSPSTKMSPGGIAPITLEFGNGQSVTAPFAVRGARAP